VPPADPMAVAQALASLRDPAVRSAAGRAARSLVQEHPDAGMVADRLASVLGEVAGRPGAGVPVVEPISVVVPVYNEGAGVDRIVGQLLDQFAPGDELVVVDDGSRDDTGGRADRLARAHPDDVRVVRRDKNGGVGAARNSGVAAAKHDLIAFTDAGCELDGNWLAALRQGFAEQPRPDFVAGVYHASAHRVMDTAMAVACYPDADEMRRPDWLVRIYGRVFGRVFTPDRPAGRSLAFTRAAYERVGGFREDMAATEDVEFSTAVARNGGRCVLAVDADLEWVQDDLRRTIRMYRKYGRGDARAEDRAVVVRDVIRVVAYAGAPLLVARGGRGARLVVATGAVAYLSLPWRRAYRRDRPLVVAAAVPVAVAAKDVAKLTGFVEELVRSRVGR
jgi:glycosyltransferase involved in cell wall biosynthesis